MPRGVEDVAPYRRNSTRADRSAPNIGEIRSPKGIQNGTNHFERISQ